jgi:hypothetical protein
VCLCVSVCVFVCVRVKKKPLDLRVTESRSADTATVAAQWTDRQTNRRFFLGKKNLGLEGKGVTAR